MGYLTEMKNTKRIPIQIVACNIHPQSSGSLDPVERHG